MKRNLASVAPALRTIIELGTGVEIYTGKELRQRQYLSPPGATAVGGISAGLEALSEAEAKHLGKFGEIISEMPKAIKDWLGYKEVVLPDGRVLPSMNGTAAYLLFKAHFLSRLFSSTQKFRADRQMMKATLEVLTGFGIREFDKTEAEEKKARNITKESQRYLQEMGELEQFPLYYSPERPAE